MNAVEVSLIAKSFGAVQAVRDVSFEVHRGEIFGLLGPNGAGKTTSLRLILDIFKPDSGNISVLGSPMNEDKKALIGYMPEDRGLYQDIPLERCIIYLGTLKGLSKEEARKRGEILLHQFDLFDHKTKKVKELSKGMQQKAQIITTILHQPELIIIDEPFTALDPVNTQMIKDLMEDLREKGSTIIMCTHQMHQVEKLCDRILLIDEGRDVLYGNLNDIRKQYSGHAAIVRTRRELPTLAGVMSIEKHNSDSKLNLAENVNPQDVLKELISKKVVVDKFEIAVPSLDEIFIRVVEEGRTS